MEGTPGQLAASAEFVDFFLGGGGRRVTHSVQDR